MTTDFAIQERITEAVRDGDLDRDTAVEVLQALGLDSDMPIRAAFRIEVTFTLSVETQANGTVPDRTVRQVEDRIAQLIATDGATIFDQVDEIKVDVQDVEDADV